MLHCSLDQAAWWCSTLTRRGAFQQSMNHAWFCLPVLYPRSKGGGTGSRNPSLYTFMSERAQGLKHLQEALNHSSTEACAPKHSSTQGLPCTRFCQNAPPSTPLAPLQTCHTTTPHCTVGLPTQRNCIPASTGPPEGVPPSPAREVVFLSNMHLE